MRGATVNGLRLLPLKGRVLIVCRWWEEDRGGGRIARGDATEVRRRVIVSWRVIGGGLVVDDMIQGAIMDGGVDGRMT
jgi:hypothetical protein